MIKYLKLFMVVVLFAITISCEDNLNPYGDLKDIYVLNCILQSDTTYHIATISKSYFPADGTVPRVSDENSIKGAILRIWNKDQIGIFKDSTVILQPDQKPYSFYYVNSFQPAEKSEVLLEAILPNGTKLSATSTVPAKVSFIADACDANISSATPDLSFAWNSFSDNSVFNVRIKVYYLHLENNHYVSKYFVIPDKYIEKDNKLYSIYSGLTSDKIYEIDMSTINRAMKELSGDDPNKLDYSITGAALEVQSLDTELSKYFFSTNRGIDSYSVNLDESDYSNVKGGAGIFGVTLRTYWRIKFTHEYIEQFGYEPFF